MQGDADQLSSLAAHSGDLQRLWLQPNQHREAWAKYEELLALPQVVWLAEPAGVEGEWTQCAAVGSTSRKVWMDAYLAAFALADSLNFVSLDQDFIRLQRRGLQLELLSKDTEWPK